MVAFPADVQLSIRDCGWDGLSLPHSLGARYDWRTAGSSSVSCRQDEIYGSVKKHADFEWKALGAGRRGKNGHRHRTLVCERWRGALHSLHSKEASICNLSVHTHAQSGPTRISRSFGFPLGIFLFASWESLAL